MAAAVSCALHGLSNGPTTIKPRVSLSARNPFHQASLQTPANLLGTSSESSFIKDSTLSSDSSMPCSEFKLMHRRQLHTSHERACLFDKSGDGPELWAGPSIGEQGRLVVRGGRELAARCLCIPGPGQSGACITDEGGTGNQGSAHRDHDEDEMGEEGAGSPSSRKGTLLGAEETGPREAPGNSGYRDGEGPSPSVSAAISLLKFYKREISPYLPGSCRYVPSCSTYAMIAFQKYGFWKGGILTAWRLLRCNPFGGTGFDPPRWFGEPKPPAY